MAQPLTEEPRDLLLDDNNDLVITNDLGFSRGLVAVTQSCRVALQIFMEEWFLDLDVGIPYFQSILAQKPRIGIEAAKIYIRRELSLVSGVIEILKLDVSYEGNTRALNVVWQVRTALGETPIDTIKLEIGG